MSTRLSLLVLVFLGAPLSARADPYLPNNERWFTIGPLLSATPLSSKPKLGLGVETTFNVLDGITALGVFGQAQWMTEGHASLGAGIQGTLVFGGVELGVMHETGTREHLPTTGLHIAPFVTFVFGSVGVRFGIPLSEPGAAGPGLPGRTRHGREVGLVLTAKIPAKWTSKGTLEPMFPWD
ncbi:hypothetical protein HUA78_33130 [Myxococcus sp. CA033]|uniref:hypothetical protein n=1 Tax=Myxococcus sp. CA033 TaxID=2741516 RepID=UPI00157B53C9|nr:hypothetical protein [Myxococcus sp. CA033]NTX39289.1 hypothetical protein [Myxococcus sp. CA033]